MYVIQVAVVLAFLGQIFDHGECAVASADVGFREIAEVFSPEQFKKLVAWIEDQNICLRRGDTAENACYMLNDCAKGKPDGMDMKDMKAVMKWTMNPFKDEEICKRWYKRLWNSIAFILAHDKVGNSRNSPLLLAKAASSENERYVPGTGGIGDKETFSKGMVDKGKQVGQGIVLDVKDALADMPETVKRVMQWMKESMP